MPSLEESHILPLYAVPVLSHVWDGAGPVNEALREAIFAREKSHPGLKKSNAGGYHSTEDLHTWSGDAGQTLFGWVIEALNHATSELFAQDNLHEEFGWGVAIWANINRTGEANKLHTHPGSTWSGVYYVDTGDGVPDRPESGRITFINPLLAERSSFFTRTLPDSRSVTPVAGQMILFPSYLQHMVQTYWGARPRISIAFNARKDPYP